MFSNILKWTFKVAIGEIEKELNLHLDNDTPIEAIEQVAIQIIAHCAKVKDAVKQQQENQEKVDMAKDVASVDDAPIVAPIAPVADPEPMDNKE